MAGGKGAPIGDVPSVVPCDSTGRLSGVEYQLLLTHGLNFSDNEPFALLDSQINEIKRMLSAFIRKLS